MYRLLCCLSGLLGAGCWQSTPSFAQTPVPLRALPHLLPQTVLALRPQYPRGHNPLPPDADARRVLNQIWYPDWALRRDSCDLLLNCDHALQAPLPLPGDQPPLRYVSAGALVYLEDSQKTVHVVPFADQATIWAYQGSRLVFKYHFRVWLIPPPTVQCQLNDAAMPQTLTLRVKPDENFGAFLPSDARYRVGRARVTLLRDGQSVGEFIFRQIPWDAPAPALDLAKLQAPIRPGDTLRVLVQGVQRLNYCEEIEEIPLDKQFTFPL